MGILTVGIGNPKVITLALGDISDACGKRPFVASQLLVHEVRNPVRSQAQVMCRDGMALATHILISDDIPEAHTHIEPTIGQSRHTASHERICTTLPPGGYFGAGVFIQYYTARINITELTTTLKICRDNCRDLLGRHIVTSIYNRDYTVILGITVFYSALLVFMNFLVDLTYVWLDPRIKLGGEENR